LKLQRSVALVWPMTRKRTELGKMGEKLALTYLRGLGYKILESNYRQRFGEIDIVADDGGTLVFVEVKTRIGRRHGAPSEAVTLQKQRQLSKVALAYTETYGLVDRPARFDVVGIFFVDTKSASMKTPEIELYRNAFDLCYGL
jgi:putative endonuclease